MKIKFDAALESKMREQFPCEMISTMRVIPPRSILASAERATDSTSRAATLGKGRLRDSADLPVVGRSARRCVYGDIKSGHGLKTYAVVLVKRNSSCLMGNGR